MTIVVVGDVLLDIDLAGSAQRLSPDAPVPVVDVASDGISVRAGGAGLVARLLAMEGHDVELVTALSDDSRADQLRAALPDMRIVAGDLNGPTAVKTRLRASGHAVARIDEGGAAGSVPTVTPAMELAIEEADAIIVADYGRGLTENLSIRKAISSRRGQVPIVWDPHPNGPVPVPGVDVVTPNISEALRFAQMPGGRSQIGSAVQAAEKLRDQWACEAIAVTLGEGGALLHSDEARLDPGAPRLIPAPVVECPDPCGAGDRLVATLVAQLLNGASTEAALEASVRAASTFLAAGGVSALDHPQPPAVLQGAGTDALEVARRVRRAGGTVVATGGCFDLLHAGHVRTLAAARALGDCLIVCLNSDDSTRRLKGEQRPIISEQDRVDLLNALECVDAVLVFDEDLPHDALERIQPDVWVKGGDYDADSLPEAPLVASWGGCVVTVPFHPARSTSLLATALARVS